MMIILLLIICCLLFNLFLHDHRLEVLIAKVEVDGADLAANELVRQAHLKELLGPAFTEPAIPWLRLLG